MTHITEPLLRATALGTQVALAPVRVLGTLAEGRRVEIGRDIRRSLGVSAEPKPLVMDPGRAFLHPDAVARRVHADLPSMMIAGLSTLLLQTLHPLTMAGVAEHSDYAADPVGRLRRTSAFVAYTTYGTNEQARDAIEAVKRTHVKVRGIAPDGRSYSASDPELVTWVHVAEVSTFLHSAQRFGPRRFTREQCDAYYAETSAVAYELGATWVPRSVDEVKAYFRRIRPDLYAGPQALSARAFLLRGVGTKPEDRAAYAVLAGAAVSLLPGWAKAELGLPAIPLADRLVVVPLGRALTFGLRWALTLPADPTACAERRADTESDGKT
jgi:uncharacterized protein (DUF2236 family)